MDEMGKTGRVSVMTDTIRAGAYGRFCRIVEWGGGRVMASVPCKWDGQDAFRVTVRWSA